MIDATDNCDLPTNNCLCPEPIHPPLTEDAATLVNLDKTAQLDEWCSLMTDYSTVDLLQQALDEARSETSKITDNFQRCCFQLKSLKEDYDRVSEENAALRASLKDINATHNNLLADSLTKIEEISELRLQLSKVDNSSHQALLDLIRSHLLSLPTDFLDPDTPDDTFYHFLCCQPTASMDVVNTHAKTLLRFLHPDKNSDSNNPQVLAAARIIPIITHLKRVLNTPALRQIYDHCGLFGLRSLLDSDLCCPECTPRDSNYFRLPQAPTEYPHLLVLFHLAQ